jgi:hypothetical protein
VLLCTYTTKDTTKGHIMSNTTTNTLTQVEAEALVLAHGHETKVDESGVLMGGIVCAWIHTGKVEVEWTPVPLNVSDLRNWLGY